MKQGLTEIITIIDKSGSMESIKSDAIGGFNNLIESQKETEGQTNFTLALFDDEYNLVYNGVPIKKVKKLTNTSYNPNGSTALYDAIGKTLNEVGVRLHNTKEEERPEKIIVAILTDGEENSSKEFTREKIFEMIQHQKEVYSWEFIFLAANQDAMTAASSISISATNTLNFSSTSKGINVAYTSMDCAISNYKSTGTLGNWQSNEQ